MIKRQYYLDKIAPFMNKPIVKAITGLCRVGKSTFAQQLIENFKYDGTLESNVVYIDMEQIRSRQLSQDHNLTGTCLQR